MPPYGGLIEACVHLHDPPSFRASDPSKKFPPPPKIFCNEFPDPDTNRTEREVRTMADLEAIYRRHADTVYRFLLAKTGSRDLAEELTQETFFRAVGAINRFDDNCRVTTWLCGIARNVLYGYFRSRKSGDLSLDDIPEPAVSSAEEVCRE